MERRNFLVTASASAVALLAPPFTLRKDVAAIVREAKPAQLLPPISGANQLRPAEEVLIIGHDWRFKALVKSWSLIAPAPMDLTTHDMTTRWFVPDPVGVLEMDLSLLLPHGLNR